MDLDNFKALEKSVQKPEFSKDFKGLNMILKVLSIFGNFASIFLASFFVSELLSVAIENVIVIWITTLIMLSGLELTKREVFGKFSREFIRVKKLYSKNIFPLLLFVLMLVSLSFYSSLNGAQQFASKSEVLEIVAEEQIDNYSDSINLVYNKKIALLESQNEALFEQMSKKQNDMSELPPNFITARKNIKKEIEDIRSDMDGIDSKVKEYKAERDKLINEYEKDVETDTDEEKNKNESDSLIFVLTSTLIEFLILIGIYFNKLYNFKSYKDFKSKLLNKDNYRKWYEYTEIINILYMNKEEREKIPPNEIIIELADMSKVYITSDQLHLAMNLFESLNIISIKGDIRFISKTKEEATEMLKEYFNID